MRAAVTTRYGLPEVAASGGRYLLVGFSGGPGRIARALVTGGLVHLFGRARFVTGAADPKQADLVFLQELIDAGKLRTVIGRRYTLDEIADGTATPIAVTKSATSRC